MKGLLVAGLVVVVVIGTASMAVAQNVPWQTGSGNAPAAAGAAATGATASGAAAPATGTDATGLDPKIAKAVKPVEDQIAQAEKVMKLYNDEMAKPDDKRNVGTANGYKMSAARFYLAAALKAKNVGAQFSKAEDKQTILDQFEKPNREKAVQLFLELADAAHQKKDLNSAVSLYKQVLTIDPQNAAATAGLKQIDDEAKAAKAGGTGPKSSGASGTSKDFIPGTNIPSDFGQTGRPNTSVDYGKTNRPGGPKIP